MRASKIRADNPGQRVNQEVSVVDMSKYSGPLIAVFLTRLFRVRVLTPSRCDPVFFLDWFLLINGYPTSSIRLGHFQESRP